jgi:hypothetical protein
MKPAAKIIVVLAFLVFCSTCLANELLVPTQYPTIQSAINAAVNGDTVIVAPGTYTGPGNHDIDFKGKAITVRSVDPNDPNIVASTIIDCNGSSTEPHRGFYFHSGEDANSIVDGLTITNGYAWQGGGIHCNGGSPKITNCTFSGNSASGDKAYGGGMYNYEGKPTITNCTFSGNSASGFYFGYGGGMFNYNGNVTITNCIFSENSVSGRNDAYGGGMYNDTSNLTIKNCAFNGNLGGGLYNIRSNLNITNCTFSGNLAEWGWARGGGIYSVDSATNITNCIISCNSVAYGGGICCDRSNLIINQCLISSNLSYYGGGIECERSNMTINCCTIADNSVIYGGGGILCWKSNATISNSILWGNNAIRYGPEIALTNNPNPSHLAISNTDIKGGRAAISTSSDRCTVNWGQGNINADPCFIQPGYWADANDPNIIVEPNDPNAAWLDGDYHLLSVSPCINTGDPNYIPEPNETDLDGLPRVIGGRIDMGVYEFNHHPVAVAGPNQIVYAWLDDFADVNLDGSASYDDDNDVLDYYWSWTIDGNTYEANGVNPTIKLPVGIHTIELVVDDGIDLSEPDYCTITVIKAVRGRLTIAPHVLQTKSCGKWILATLFIPPVPGDKVNTNEPLRLYPAGIEAKYQRFFKYGRFGCSPTIALAFFDKQMVSDALGPGRFEVSIVGEFLSGRFLFGSDTIKILSPPPKPPHHRH